MRSVFGFAIALAVVSAAPAQGRALHKGEVVVSTTLDAVRADPDAFKKLWVRFTVQFCSLGKVKNPFFTRFVPSRFANFYAWSTDQAIWRKDEYDDVFAMLFLSKDSEQSGELYELDLYDRLEVTGVVQNTFQGKPWIEVVSFERVDDQVDTATLAHLFRGESHMKLRQWQRAISELSLAPADGVPEEVVAAVHRNLGTCYLRLGEVDQAKTHLAMAQQANERDRETLRLIDRATNDPDDELDRAVDRSSVSDHERPMWEAFEKLARPSTPSK